MASSGTGSGTSFEGLSIEIAGVWSGWKCLGDREIVREASAKGTHIDLAYKFLAHRRHCSIQEAKAYFSSEVEIWVNALLNKQQVHRASHVLNNVGKIPADYIKATCLKCKDAPLRNYLARHVESSFNTNEKEAWNMVNLITNYEQKYNLQSSLISHKCLEEIINLPQVVKDALYTELYFYHYEPNIVVYLKNDIVWDYLLINNKIDLLMLWIDLNFGEDLAQQKEDRDDAKLLFSNLKITNAMVDYVEFSNATPLHKNIILNYLSRYGIFTSKESKNIKLILSRFFGECLHPSEFQTILSKQHCNVDKSTFLDKIDVIGLSRNYQIEDNNTQIIDAKNKKLYDSLKEMCTATNEYKNFLELGIVETINYLSDDVNEYLKQNPIVAFTLIFLHYSKCKQDSNIITLKDVFNSEEGLTTKLVTISKEVLDSVVHHLSYIKNEIEPQTIKNNITMYQLLDGYKNFNANKFFKWRFRNKTMPDFLNENLVRKYGHKEKLTYIYYLKEARPNMAAHIFEYQQGKIAGGISSKAKSEAAMCSHIFALRNSKKLDIVSGCISFLEILGVSSENLRLHITAANYVQNELNISIENSLEMIIFNNQQELKLVLNYLERSFYSRLNLKIIENTEEFIESLYTWDMIVRFAKAHNTFLPTSLLKFLASYDAWFQFALVAHIFAYPLNQVSECLHHIENLNIKEHLLLALNNSQLERVNLQNDNIKSKNEKLRARDRLSINDENDIKQKSSGQSSPPNSITEIDSPVKSSSSSININIIPDASTFVNDLWLIILKCHQSQDPPGALLNASITMKFPILTILATCYEPSSISSYCYSWLVISVDNQKFTHNYAEYLDNQIWSASTVLNLFDNIISYGYVVTLCRGFHIFLPDNPLKLFFEFLVQCLEYGNYDSSQYLADFIAHCSNCKCNKMINWECNDATYLENVYWIQTIVVKCIIAALGNALQSTCTQIQFLNVLIKSEFHTKLIVDSPNFESLLQYTKILSETNVSLNFFCFDTTVKIHESEAEIEKCVDELINFEDYDNALRLSKAASLKASKIILAQYRSEFKRNADKDGVVDPSFWSRCSNDFEKYEVCYEKAAEFLVEHAEKVKSDKDRYEILKLALEILQRNCSDQQTCDTVEMSMWKSCILAGPENIEIKPQTTVFEKLKTELLCSVSELQVTCTLASPEEKLAVDVLIGRLLDAGRLDTAIRISAIFNYKNRELQVLMLCLTLAEGEISPYQLSVQQRSLLSTSDQPRQRNSTLRSRGLQRLPSTSSLNLTSPSANLSNVSVATVIEQQEQLDCLSLLTNLIETIDHGIDIGIRILLCYRLAVQLGKDYTVLLTLKNPMQFFQEVISSSCDRRLEIARDIITTYQIENQRIANFLAEEIVAHITQVIEDGLNEPTTAWNNYNMNLQSVIDLCKDSSLLGLKLLDMANKLLGHSNGEKRNLVTLKIIVELLIRSHDCFTASCNMEGIASVLRKCQQLANSLQILKHWSLLVRLVTGVGRFTEMNYIFQILKEHDQFESLLGRGLDKVPGLRMALLDFLKKHCPEDESLFQLVALHFRLHYEVALIWENEAKDVINDLVNEAKKDCGKTVYNPQMEIKFTRNEVTEKRLQLVIANYTHATQYFLQGNKLNLGNRCSHQAQLVALQISLANSCLQNQQFPCILNLTSDEINKVICRHLNFSQGLILARAYDHHVDWASALYSHCLVNGETKYLRDFITSKRLTASVVVDCARKYRLEKNITKTMTEMMQTLLAKLTDYECKYIIASQLGFRKILEAMIDDPVIGAYLKDTVFKKRFVTSECESLVTMG